MRLSILLLFSLAPLAAQSPNQRIATGALDVLTFAWTNLPPAIPGGMSLGGGPVAFDEAARVHGLFVSIDHTDAGVTAFRFRCTVTLEDGQRLPVDELIGRTAGGRAFRIVAMSGKLRPVKLESLTITPLRPDADLPLTLQ